MPFTPTTIPISGRTVLVGVNTFGPFSVPNGAAELDFRVDRTLFVNPLSNVSGILEVSQDSGSTWAPQGTFGDMGGVAIGDHGVIITDFYMLGVDLGDSTNLNRKVKLTLTITVTPFATLGGTVDLR